MVSPSPLLLLTLTLPRTLTPTPTPTPPPTPTPTLTPTPNFKPDPSPNPVQVDLPSEGDFIDALVLGAKPNARKKLRCVVLNGCETISLARSIIGRCPNLQVVCWQSITDDSAARAFMIGFYRTVGADLTQDTVVNVEAAYRAGLASFEAQGFVLGDPSPYLHPPEHEHTAAPRYGECQGCSPPVHGQPALVSCKDGRLHVQTGHGLLATYGLGEEAL